MRLLDLFCGAGGAADGYHAAGFDVVGVDIRYQPNYPFEFVQADALDLPRDFVESFDVIHASPPCQHWTKYRNVVKDITDRYEDLIAPTRVMLETFDIPYVLENVPSSPVDAALILCGSMFGLDVRRHRLFETGNGFPFVMSPPCNHKGWARRFKSSTGRVNKRFTIEVGAWDEPLALQMECMGHPPQRVMALEELSESIPPAYTRFIGEQFLQTQAPANY